MGWFGFCMISSFFGGDGDGGVARITGFVKVLRGYGS